MSADPPSTDLATEARPQPLSRDAALLDRLTTWLHDHVRPDWRGVRLVGLTRVSGGVSNETWLLDVQDQAAPDAAPTRLVLRREPLRGPFEPYDIGHEARMISGLADTGVPVPPLLGHCSDPAVAGRPFIVLGYIAGEIPDYRNIAQRPEWHDLRRRAQMTDEFVRVLAELQRVDWTRPALAGALSAPATERERLHGLIDEMVDSARQRTAEWVPLPIFGDAAAWCRRHAPDGDRAEMVIVHADYRVGNFIWQDDRIIALLDWEGAIVGDPMQDLGYACHPAQREAHPELMAMLSPLDQLVARYEHHTGRTVDLRRLHYYVIYSLLFHTWTLLVGLPSVVEWGGDMRMATAYPKLNQVTRLLAAEIEAYEDGRGVL
jgi:aminoglycoside phosphotransferase (APT) family kinase protein